MNGSAKGRNKYGSWPLSKAPSIPVRAPDSSKTCKPLGVMHSDVANEAKDAERSVESKSFMTD